MVFSVQWRTKEEEEIGLTSRPELGCNMSGFLFRMVIDWIMRKTVRYGESGIRWKLQSKPDNLDFADNVALLSSIRQHMQHKGTRMDEAAKRVGLRINKTKTKVLRINARNKTKLTIDGQGIEELDEFTYLRAKICKEGGRNGRSSVQVIKGKEYVR